MKSEIIIPDEDNGYRRLGRQLSDISEDDDDDGYSNSTDLFEINRLSRVGMMDNKSEMSSLFSLDVHGFGDLQPDVYDDSVYVAVHEDGDTSMDALAWTLRDIIVAGQDTAAQPPSTALYLVHVFPFIHTIPSPLGNLPIRDVIPEQVETHKAQERYKRRQMLQKFVTPCISSKVKVDTILIESDRIAMSILDLISMFNIRKLVLGTSKSNLRRLGSKKGNGIADQILRKAPGYCQVKIVCEGKLVVLDQDTESSVGSSGREVWDSRSGHGDEVVHCMEYFSCICFKPRTTM